MFNLLTVEPTTVPAAMNSFLAVVSTFFTKFFTWLTEAFTFVTNQPILLAFVILSLVGLVLYMVRKWIPGRA